MYHPFNLKYKLRFGTRPEKALGEVSDWEFVEKILKTELEKSDKEYNNRKHNRNGCLGYNILCETIIKCCCR